MKLRKALVEIIFGIMVLGSSGLLAREFHVSVAGSDTNDGSVQKPLRTISAAARLAQAGDLVTVHTGTYRERITPPRGGHSDALRIVYQAAEGERVEIKGSEVVKGWKKISDSVWKVEPPNTLFDGYNPYRELIGGDWFNRNGRDHHTGEVYLNGVSLWEAARLEDVLDSKDGRAWWYCETSDQATTIWADFGGFDPNEELVEINVRPTCFYPDRPGIDYITVRGFAMRHAATQWAPPTAEQIGLIGTHWSKGWIIEDNVISDSRCTGITLGKYHDPEDKVEASANQYNQTIRLALRNGWSRERIGSHIVRNNTISRCEQAGICGSMGAIFSLVTGNHIHDIWVKRLFSGAEIGGIKFHGAIDSEIINNHIHHAGRGLWLDWMTQGTRVSRNLLYENSTDDLFLEVNHGPFLVDNNILLSETAARILSEGGAFVHNLVAGEIIVRPVPGRSTPFHKPHSTEVAGLSSTRGGDDRWYNNVFIGYSGLKPYDETELPVWMDGNVFLNGAKASKHEKDPAVRQVLESKINLVAEPDGVYLYTLQDEEWEANRPNEIVSTRLLGRAKLADQGYTNTDGTPVKIDTDYFGERRKPTDPASGPFARINRRDLKVKVWP
jgi:alpha-N-arabinofuranosidase